MTELFQTNLRHLLYHLEVESFIKKGLIDRKQMWADDEDNWFYTYVFWHIVGYDSFPLAGSGSGGIRRLY